MKQLLKKTEVVINWLPQMLKYDLKGKRTTTA